MRVDRFIIARAFGVHPSSVAAWLREGLAEARVRPGAPGQPALFDAQTALIWLNNRKAYLRRTPCTAADLRAIVHESRTSAAGPRAAKRRTP